ncbi:hypothetical protein [Pseudoalteromonas phenolica]|uniref:hypothetical protein n=1 Tax=Pseudoalteromonas phenolica TaxID=161398 RepID=UPI00110B37A6|nr:hypothetical protein [Pseudoalteromonas phenolica]TMO52557.1 hypothetical protein CWC21_21680 [Pseudoalteromonas phenolica]
MNLKAIGLVLLSALHVSGCGSDAHAGNEIETPPVEGGKNTCTGFGSPHINVFIRESLNSDVLIENASVRVVMESENEESTVEPVFISSDDRNEDTKTGAYHATLEHNNLAFDVSIVVFAEEYHSFVTKNISFEVNTGCGASNDLTYEVYLCPIGTTCL